MPRSIVLHLDAIDRADFQARLAAGAVVGVDDRQLFRNFFAGTLFGHFRLLNQKSARSENANPIVNSFTIIFLGGWFANRTPSESP